MLSEIEIEQGLAYSLVKRRAVHQDSLKFSYKRVILNDPCVYCGGPESNGRDHIWARSKGGKDNWRNRAPACHACDHWKGSKKLLVFLVTNQDRRDRAEGHMRRLRALHTCVVVNHTLPAPVAAKRKTFVVMVLEAASIVLRAADALVTKALVRVSKQIN